MVRLWERLLQDYNKSWHLAELWDEPFDCTAELSKTSSSLSEWRQNRRQNRWQRTRIPSPHESISNIEMRVKTNGTCRCMVLQIRDVVARSAPCNYKGSRLDPICHCELLPGVWGIGSTMVQPDKGKKGHLHFKIEATNAAPLCVLSARVRQRGYRQGKFNYGPCTYRLPSDYKGLSSWHPLRKCSQTDN